MSSIESILTRELDLRFIDARTIAAEARITLGIEGYPSKEQLSTIRDEAVRIFYAKSIDEQMAMQRMNRDLKSFKFQTDSLSTRESMLDSTSDHSLIASDVSSRQRGIRGFFRR